MVKIHKLLFSIVLSVFTLSASAYNVIAFGDSVTAGLKRTASRVITTWGCNGGAKCGGAIPYLETYLDNNLEASNVYNWGWPGELTGGSSSGTPGGIYRIDGVLNTGSVGDIVLLMEGLNDIIHGLSSGDIINNMEIMINKVRNKNMYPILGLTTPNTNDGRVYSTGRSIVNPNLALMADRKGVQWVDHFRNIYINSSWSNNNSGDLLHLSTAGNIVLAQGWYDAISIFDTQKAQLNQLNSQIKANNTAARSVKNKLSSFDDMGSNEVIELINAGLACANSAVQQEVSIVNLTSSLASLIVKAKAIITAQNTNINCANNKYDEAELVTEQILTIFLAITPLL